MSPYSSEELVSRDHVLNEKPTALINIVDVTNIERNLYLTMQLLEMDVPTVVFWRHAASVTTVFSISFGLVKGALFGGLVGLIGCGAGMRTKSTADGVGVAATSAVVGGIVAIAVADGLLAYLCYLWNL
jgi:ABC-type transporter Mla maintaining outer membrane lipid asymmetry permease subunit MlaE